MKIAISQRVIDYKNGPYDSIDHGLYSMFNGHTLCPIPNNLKHFNSNTIIESDLVVFSGGNSLVSDDWQYSDIRLKIEKHALDLALAYKKPILGLSRGSQFLNVMLGGTIMRVDGHKEDHKVYYKAQEHTVVSRHTESFATIPPGATVLATDEQGNVESWKIGDIGCVLWHPERMEDHWMPDELVVYK